MTSNGNQSIPNTTWTTLQFNTDIFDTDNMHDISSNNHRLVCKVSGLYQITINILFPINTTGGRAVCIVLNESMNICRQSFIANNITDTGMSATVTYPLVVGDVIHVSVQQNSGGALNVVNTGDTRPLFSMVKVG